MKPYKHIQDTEKVLKRLINRARNGNSARSELQDVNVLINLVNSYKDLLKNKYKTNVLDNLLLSGVYKNLTEQYAITDGFHLNEAFIAVEKELMRGNNKRDCINNLFRDYALSEQIKNGKELVIHDYTKELNNLLIEFKTNIIWRTSISKRN